MSDTLIKDRDSSLWLICETGERWADATRRFAPELLPPAKVPRVLTIDFPPQPDRLAAKVNRQRAIVLWEATGPSLRAVCDGITVLAMQFPRVLQFVAATELGHQERMTLQEFRCAAHLRHPEDLQKLRPMIKGYFASR